MKPLEGVRIIEIGGLGPAPFCCMVLADLGAEILRIDRPGTAAGVEPGARAEPVTEIVTRGRRSATLDLKKPAGARALLRLAERADALIEGFRPGVMERLGVGPAECLAVNPRLAYGRLTGWGQEGPLAREAGHDINYAALSGTLGMFGNAGGPPVAPLNIVEFGGAGMLMALGVVSVILNARQTGTGQVIDAAIIDGAALLATGAYMMAAQGRHQDKRGVNVLDNGSHFYNVYETADGGYLAVGPSEPQFYAAFLERAGLDQVAFADQWNEALWPEFKRRIAAHIKTRTRDEWTAIFEGADCCVTPVLNMEEAARHPHNVVRGTFMTLAGVRQPAPAPRFSAAGDLTPSAPTAAGAHTRPGLADWGFSQVDIAALAEAGALG